VFYQVDGQAHAVAHAGVVDALAWFRRQQSQPVKSFAPRLDLSGPPEARVNETDDPTIGIVREYEVGAGVWGRYEVRTVCPAEVFVDTDHDGIHDREEAFTDLNGDGKWNCAVGTRDVSGLRGWAGDGWVWQLESIGMLYLRDEPGEPLGTGRNRLLATYKLSTEIRRLMLALPAQAAINARTGGLVQLMRGSHVWAPQTAVAVGTAAVRVQVSPFADIVAPTTSVNVPEYHDDFLSVFGVDWNLLQAMSDIAVSEGSASSGTVPDYSLVTVSGDVTYDEDNPLTGLGIVAVRGDVTIVGGSGSYFRGVLYVEGNLRIDAPALVRGSIICTGAIHIEGTGGDSVQVEHDPDLINDILGKLGQYRHTKVVYITSRVQRDGRPDDS
jgi:hypothetical protein